MSRKLENLHFVDGTDLRRLTRPELLALKEQFSEAVRHCNQQYKDACAAYNVHGEESDPDWLSRVQGARRVMAAKLHRVEMHLSLVRESEKRRNVAQSAQSVQDTHLQYLHAFHAIVRNRLRESESGRTMLDELTEGARTMAEQGDRQAVHCERCRMLAQNASIAAPKEPDLAESLARGRHNA